MTTKKDIPLDMLKAIEKTALANLDIIQKKDEDNTYYSFVETDLKSNNFFKVFIDGTKRLSGYDKKLFTYEWKPVDSARASHSARQGSIQEVSAQFDKWVKLIREINETQSVHDDIYSKYYSDFYFNEFKIVDNDADTSPFNPIQQDLLELYFDSLSNAIESSTGQLGDIIKTELISEIKEIKLALNTSTKTKVMKGITKVFGKLYTTSKPFAKEVITEAKKRLIKKLFDLGIEYGPKILEMFNNSQS
jgi:hypothetical protein